MFRFAKEISVTAPSRTDLLADIRTSLKARRGFSVATLNLDHVIKLRRDPVFAEAYRQHRYITADGNPIVMLSKLAGTKVELIPGSELIEPVAQIAQQENIEVALFGSVLDSLEPAARALETNFPGLRIALRHSPQMGFDPTGAEAVEFVDMLRQSGVGLCFLALGAPKQEIFAAFAQDQVPEVGFFSIGAGLDFISGKQVRAPKVVRRLMLEWLWRWVKNPRRLTARYLGCIAILPRLAMQASWARFVGQ